MIDMTKQILLQSSLLFTNHLRVLLAIRHDPSIRIRELSLVIGLTERSTQRVINDLESLGVVDVSRTGRRNRYAIRDSAEVELPDGGTVPLEALLAPLSR